MSALFDGAMRRAAILLFILALVLLVSGVYSALQTFGAMQALAAALPASLSNGMIAAASPANKVHAIVVAVGIAAIPYFGAAILWRLDRRAPGSFAKVPE